MNAVPQFRAIPTTHSIFFSCIWNKDIQISLSIFFYLSLLPKAGQIDSHINDRIWNNLKDDVRRARPKYFYKERKCSNTETSLCSHSSSG